jgi:GDP-L-fucose synthase
MTKYFNGKHILVTGGAGFLGQHVVDQIFAVGRDVHITVSRREKTDLRKWEACVRAVKDIDIVIHLAADVGGIQYNQAHPARLFYDNALMGMQVIEAARQEGVEKCTIIGTVCAYPKFTPSPFKEESIWEGYPEETNAPYGLAKKMLMVQSQAYRQEYGFNSIYLLPVNLYGIGDNFNPESSHVIPALIKKFVDAKEQGLPTVSVWGSGDATREFLYVDDCARGIVLATELYNKPEPVNLGSGMDITIRNLANLIKKLTGYDGEIVWDSTKPDGQPKRRLSVDRAKQEFGFVAKVGFTEGLRKTINWYVDEYRPKEKEKVTRE